jgi:RNA-directed DNA polymerase
MTMLNIQNIEDLAERIKVPVELLQKMCREIDAHVQYTPRNKPNGEIRDIYSPSTRLKSLLQLINSELLQPIFLPETLQGSVPARSPLTNARIHSGQPYVISVDIRDFYPSVHYTRVQELFKNLGCSISVAKMLTRLTTYDYHLAQGFPTSSSIANLILKEIEPRFVNLCQEHNLRFSFYQDDLTVSGSYRARKLFNLIVRILEQSGFSVNRTKSKVKRHNQQQKVTGYVVNRAVNVPKDYYREVRKTVYYCNRYGVDSQADTDVVSFLQSLYGKIEWVRSANPKKGAQLLDQFRLIPEAQQLFNL